LKSLFLLLVLLLVLPSLQADEKGHECGLTHPRLSGVVNAQCHDLQVPLDFEQLQGEKIQLHVAVIPAKGKNPQPEPLFFFAGGPGQSATDTALLMWPVFSKIVQQRDIVLIDQRGTGKSTPLDCPKEEQLELIADDSLLEKHARDCLESLDEDVRYFTSRQAVQDVEWVRKYLGYQRINLMGVSYGTRVAQLVLREYPENVRSIVLDGVIPLETVVGPEMAVNLQQSLLKLRLNCDRDTSCHETFPNLQQDWDAYQRLPLDKIHNLELSHPRTGETLELEVSRESLDVAVRLLSYSSENRSLLPLLLHTAVEGDWKPMLMQALLVAVSLEGEMSEGMHNSVVCSEDVPFFNNLPEVSGKVMGHFPQQLQKICAPWPKGKSYADIHRPLKSDVPALVLSGELDPVTPAAYGELALKQFSRGLHLVIPGQGHNVLPRGCVPRLAADFIADLLLKEKETICVQDTARLPFFIDMQGPAS
jgi:pimeloyl-ACP methyl ester carboxylesterase